MKQNEKIMKKDEEIELIKNYQNGDNNAFKTLYEANKNLILSIAKSFENLSKINSALYNKDDLLNDVIISFEKSIRLFNETKDKRLATFFTYSVRYDLYKIYNKLLKDKNKYILLEDKLEDENVREIDKQKQIATDGGINLVESKIFYEEFIQEAKKFLKSFATEKELKVFDLKYVKCYSREQIAKLMKITSNAVIFHEKAIIRKLSMSTSIKKYKENRINRKFDI